MSVSYTPAELLFMRLRQLGAYDAQGTGDSDDARNAILGALCSEAVAGRLEAGGKCLTFRALFEKAFDKPFETRERAAKRKSS